VDAADAAEDAVDAAEDAVDAAEVAVDCAVEAVDCAVVIAEATAGAGSAGADPPLTVPVNALRSFHAEYHVGFPLVPKCPGASPVDPTSYTTWNTSEVINRSFVNLVAQVEAFEAVECTEDTSAPRLAPPNTLVTFVGGMIPR